MSIINPSLVDSVVINIELGRENHGLILLMSELTTEPD
jgi:hypothetical protein